ncbi:MAG: transglutaminase domain-containing protein, partial [Planctomycetes bacterium]|nr:transglutaminase domain-containing protein [Planctomycetota bacterium]
HGMQRYSILPVAGVFALTVVSIGRCAEPPEPFLRELPAGLFLEHVVEAEAAQAKAIGKKLGGQIHRITNSILRVHGRPIQVNAITAVDEVNARAIHATLEKIKAYPFCMRKGRVVIEYVGADIDAALAIKTSYELGLLKKPESVRYRVIAELATVAKADYMACTPLFAQFIALQNGSGGGVLEKIKELSKRFEFGRSLTLRDVDLGRGSGAHKFQPAPAHSERRGFSITYSFDRIPDRQGVPYVTATTDIDVDGSGFRASSTAPPKGLTAATAFWPADDPRLTALAKRITAGRTTNDGKVMAILEWLTPGRNLAYSGQTGSRWGTAKVFEQGYGHCWDFSDCFVTLARSAGVPCVQVAGWLYGSSGHVWAEYYREGKGWQQVDPTGGGKLPCGIYHIPYFTSEDGEMPILYVSMPKIEPAQAK